MNKKLEQRPQKREYPNSYGNVMKIAMKRCSALLFTRAMQSNTTVRYHSSTSMAKL